MPYSVEELKALKEKASNYCTRLVTLNSRFTYSTRTPQAELPCYWLYRNNHEWYFEGIRRNSRNPGWMTTTTKDGSGDPRSPINLQQYFKGLFFCATLWNGDLPTTSPYGPVRLKIPSSTMLNNKRIYFADFYCTAGGHNGNHYLILVITTPESQNDVFCQSKLLQLDLYNNPFLYYSNGQLYVNQTPKVCIEICYAEHIKVYEGNLLCIPGASFDRVIHKPRASQSIVMKNPSCPDCNINFNPMPVVYSTVSWPM